MTTIRRALVALATLTLASTFGAAPAGATGSTVLAGGGQPPLCVHASGQANSLRTAANPTRPCGLLIDGYVVRVTDATSESNCATGGGSAVGLLQYDAGAAGWRCASGGGGGGLTNPLTVALDAGGYKLSNIGAPTTGTDAARNITLSGGSGITDSIGDLSANRSISLAPAEIGTTTFGPGTDFDWTFNGAAATDPKLRVIGEALVGSGGNSFVLSIVNASGLSCLYLDGSSPTDGNATAICSTPSGTNLLTVPAGSGLDTFALLGATQTLTNKTLGTGSVVPAAYLTGTIAAARLPDADGSNKGAVQLAGSLGGTAAAPRVKEVDQDGDGTPEVSSTPGSGVYLDPNETGTNTATVAATATGAIVRGQLNMTPSSAVAGGFNLSNAWIASEGATNDANEGYFYVPDWSADRTLTVPDLSGTFLLSSAGSATDNAILRADGTTGALAQASPCTMDDNGGIDCAAHPTDGGALTLKEGADDGSNFFRFKLPDSGVTTDRTVTFDANARASSDWIAYAATTAADWTAWGASSYATLVTALDSLSTGVRAVWQATYGGWDTVVDLTNGRNWTGLGFTTFTNRCKQLQAAVYACSDTDGAPNSGCRVLVTGERTINATTDFDDTWGSRTLDHASCVAFVPSATFDADYYPNLDAAGSTNAVRRLRIKWEGVRLLITTAGQTKPLVFWDSGASYLYGKALPSGSGGLGSDGIYSISNLDVEGYLRIYRDTPNHTGWTEGRVPSYPFTSSNASQTTFIGWFLGGCVGCDFSRVFRYYAGGGGMDYDDIAEVSDASWATPIGRTQTTVVGIAKQTFGYHMGSVHVEQNYRFNNYGLVAGSPDGGDLKPMVGCVGQASPVTGPTFTADDTTDKLTISSHYFTTGDRVRLTTTGTLPGGLATATDYWFIDDSTNTLKIASSLANAQAGTAIDLTTTGSGTHTVQRYTACAYGAVHNGTLDLAIIGGDLEANYFGNIVGSFTYLNTQGLHTEMYGGASDKGHGILLCPGWTSGGLPCAIDEDRGTACNLSARRQEWVAASFEGTVVNTDKGGKAWDGLAIGPACKQPFASNGNRGLNRVTIVGGYYGLSNIGKTAGVTVTGSAANDTLTFASHRLQRGQVIQVSSSGSLPTGLSAATNYYVIPEGTSLAVKVATSLANADNGVAIDLTSDGSGTITATFDAYDWVLAHPNATTAIDASSAHREGSLAGSTWPIRSAYPYFYQGMKTCEWTLVNPTTGLSGFFQCRLPEGALLSRAFCSTSANTVTANLYERSEGTPNTGTTELLSADLVCDTDGNSTSTFTDRLLAPRSYLTLGIDSVTTTSSDAVRFSTEYLTP